MNEFDTETLYLALREIGMCLYADQMKRLKTRFPEMNEDKLNRLKTIVEETISVATDIVFKHYYKEKQSNEAVTLLLKNNVPWANDKVIDYLFWLAHYYLK